MLDDYKDEQANAYNIMMNEIKNNHISHAYLFDENNNNHAFDIVIAFVKEIICNDIENKEKRQAIIKRIDDGNYPELKIIEPDGMLIKKQQIIELQHDFSMISTEGNKRIYIIRDCEKMRPETANSMLKFLEEPDNHLIAILMTNNYNNLLSTIISRCQIIRFNNWLTNDNDNELDFLVLNFINDVENNGIKAIINTQSKIFSAISLKDREKITVFFDKMINMYYDILKIKISNEKNVKYYDKLSLISKRNNLDNILKKINFLVETKDVVKYNVNCNLLIDSLIVNIGG